MFSINELSIRPIDKLDLEWLRNLRNEQSTWSNLGNSLMISDIQQENWYNELIKDKSRMYFIVQKEEMLIGIVRFTQIDWINRSICVGADILPEQRRQGYGSQVYDLIFAYCFDNLNMNRIWLLVTEYNTAGLLLYKKKGFVQEGIARQAIYRNGRYWDYILMGLLRDERL